MGVYLRIVGKLNESEKHLKTAIQIYKELEQSRRVFINTLRLAHTYQWWTKFDISNQMFSELREQAESDPDLSDLLDFVYQHTAKIILIRKNTKPYCPISKKHLTCAAIAITKN